MVSKPGSGYFPCGADSARLLGVLLAGFLRGKDLWRLRIEPTLFSRFDRRWLPLGLLALLDFPRLDNKRVARLIHGNYP